MVTYEAVNMAYQLCLLFVTTVTAIVAIITLVTNRHWDMSDRYLIPEE